MTRSTRKNADGTVDETGAADASVLESNAAESVTAEVSPENPVEAEVVAEPESVFVGIVYTLDEYAAMRLTENATWQKAYLGGAIGTYARTFDEWENGRVAVLGG